MVPRRESIKTTKVFQVLICPSLSSSIAQCHLIDCLIVALQVEKDAILICYGKTVKIVTTYGKAIQSKKLVSQLEFDFIIESIGKIDGDAFKSTIERSIDRRKCFPVFSMFTRQYISVPQARHARQIAEERRNNARNYRLESNLSTSGQRQVRRSPTHSRTSLYHFSLYSFPQSRCTGKSISTNRIAIA